MLVACNLQTFQHSVKSLALQSKMKLGALVSYQGPAASIPSAKRNLEIQGIAFKSPTQAKNTIFSVHCDVLKVNPEFFFLSFGISHVFGG